MKAYTAILFLILLSIVFSCKSPVEQTEKTLSPVLIDTAFVPSGITVGYSTMKTLKISWIDSTTRHKKGFILERAIDNPKFEVITSVSDSENYFLDTIKNYGYYSYRIRTFTDTDTSEPSSSYYFFVENIVPENVFLQRLSIGSVQLSWRDRFPYQHSFIIERKIDSGGFLFLTVKDSGTFSLIDTLTGYHSYQYRIAAFHGNDTTSKIISNSYSVNDPIPTQLKVDYYDQEIFQVSWNDGIPFESGFMIEKSINNGPFSAFRITKANITSLLDTVTTIAKIKYRIYAIAGNTKSPLVESNEISVSNWLPGKPYTRFSGVLPIQFNNGDILLTDYKSTYMYNYKDRQWEKKGDMTANLGLGNALALNKDEIFSIGGGIGIETPGGLSAVVNEIYNRSTEVWRIVSSLHTDLTMSHYFTPVLSSDGMIYIAGIVGDHQYDVSKFNSFAEKYSPTSGGFVTIASLPQTIIGNQGSFVSTGKILMTGGVIWKGNTSDKQLFTDSCYLYDIATDQWSRGPNLASVRGWHYSFSLNNGNNVIILGGSSDVYDTQLSTYEVFDAQTLTWRSTKSLPEINVYAVTKSTEDTVYAILGNKYNGTKALYRYTLSNDNWEKVVSFPVQTMPAPVYLAHLPNNRFIVIGSGESHPLFYLPELK